MHILYTLETFLLEYLSKNYIEVIGAILTILCVWFNTKVSNWGWIFGILSTCAYLYVAWQSKLYGFFILNIFFILTNIYGLWNWNFGKLQGEEELPITSLTITQKWQVGSIGIVVSIIFSLFLHYLGSTLAWADGTIFAFSLLSQGLLAQKKVENWLLWIIINCVSIIMFFILAYWVSVVLYILLLVLAIKGFRDWKERLAL